jgi:hypothetical protein
MRRNQSKLRVILGQTGQNATTPPERSFRKYTPSAEASTAHEECSPAAALAEPQTVTNINELHPS